MTQSHERDEDRAVLPIGAVAELVGVHPRTIRQYERHGLITPARRNGQRRFSQNDVKWLRCIRSLIHDRGFNIVGLAKLLEYAPCWELRDCPEEVRARCQGAHSAVLRCWEQRARLCPDGSDVCSECEVYLAATRGPLRRPRTRT